MMYLSNFNINNLKFHNAYDYDIEDNLFLISNYCFSEISDKKSPF